MHQALYKKQADYFLNGVCSDCQLKSHAWNRLLQWAAARRADPLAIIELITDPAARPVYLDDGGARRIYQVTGYQSFDFETGEVTAVGSLSSEEECASFLSMFHLMWTAKVIEPLYLFPSRCDQKMFWSHLRRLFGETPWGIDLLTTHLLSTGPHGPLHMPKPGGKDWLDLPKQNLAQDVYYTRLCELFGLAVEPGTSVTAMLRRVVGYLAAQEPIEGV